jgi:hypothetical protein
MSNEAAVNGKPATNLEELYAYLEKITQKRPEEFAREDRLGTDLSFTPVVPRSPEFNDAASC